MIFIQLKGHDYRYETEDIVKMFFDREEMCYCDNKPPEDSRGVFLLIQMSKDTTDCKIEIQLKAGEIIHRSEVVVGLDMDEADSREKEKTIKRALKRLIYQALSGYTKKEPPWGVLTGIRPAKIIHKMLEQNLTKDKILFRLKQEYRVSKSKAELLWEVASNERRLLDKTDKKMIGVYVGIPFCTSRCLYCSFASNPITKYREWIGKYLEAVEREMISVSEIIRNYGYTIQSLYIGGGTPTAFEPWALQRLLELVDRYLDLKRAWEYTLEAGRPDSINREKLSIIKNSKVNRISINPQTMNDQTLQMIGRNHTARDIIDTFYLAREIGFDNINADLIIGLPGENLPMFENTLDEIKKLSPESLTVHTLAVKRASKFKQEKESFQLTSGDMASSMSDRARDCAKSMGLKPYYLYRQKDILGNLENIGYCRPGFESIYNIQIMEERQSILAIGAGAVSKVVYPEENRIERVFNVKNVEEYITRIGEMIERKKHFFDI